MDMEVIFSDEEDIGFVDLMESDDEDTLFSQPLPSSSCSMYGTEDDYLDFGLDDEEDVNINRTPSTSPQPFTDDEAQSNEIEEKTQGELDGAEMMEEMDSEGLEISHSSDEDMEDKPPEALEHIENMVLDFLTQLSKSGLRDPESDCDESLEPSDEKNQGGSSKKAKPKPKIEISLADRKKAEKDGEQAMRTIRYPRLCPSGSARPLAQLFSVLNFTHEALVTRVPLTKRDMYYKDVALFKSQRVVNQLVDDLAATWNLRRSDLNIRAASKGLLIGSGLTIHLFTGESLGINIPVGEDIDSFSVDETVKWVLVVEKEAVFQTLCRLGVADHPDLPGRGLVITGKGYPDVATRHLVKSLSDALPRSIPIVALVDCDPYGLDILSVYRYGSTSMQHENDTLAARRIRWLGLRCSELSTLGIDLDALLPITKSDEKKILSMLQRPNLPKKWKKELTRTLHMRRKAEIEIVSRASELCARKGVHPLLAYLRERLACVVPPETQSDA